MAPTAVAIILIKATTINVPTNAPKQISIIVFIIFVSFLIGAPLLPLIIGTQFFAKKKKIKRLGTESTT